MIPLEYKFTAPFIRRLDRKIETNKVKCIATKYKQYINRRRAIRKHQEELRALLEEALRAGVVCGNSIDPNVSVEWVPCDKSFLVEYEFRPSDIALWYEVPVNK